ncbi:hypothetical protein GOODEAATRI_024628 [Goodea atripinnis]|uniref:Uncharacterized protein n=1 Tax=Goodea atripinnis TaxID=208336 RepID=A0ABV0MNF7_9TELE
MRPVSRFGPSARDQTRVSVWANRQERDPCLGLGQASGPRPVSRLGQAPGTRPISWLGPSFRGGTSVSVWGKRQGRDPCLSFSKSCCQKLDAPTNNPLGFVFQC